MNIDYKVWLIALVLVAIVLVCIHYPIHKKNAAMRGKEEFNLRTLSTKNVALNDSVQQQMAVFYLQLGEWILAGKPNHDIFDESYRLCWQLGCWTTAHRKVLNSIYPDLAHVLRTKLAYDLRASIYRDSIDPFSDLADEPYDVYLNLKRQDFIRQMQQKYNVLPTARI